MTKKTPTPEQAFEYLMKCPPPSKEEMALLGWKTNTTGQRTKITQEMLTPKTDKVQTKSKVPKKANKEIITNQ